VKDYLCKKCHDHVAGPSSYIHLTCGREGQHVMTDIEINELISEINKNDLLEMLTIEKGSTAKIMIQTLSIETPIEILYTKEDVLALLETLETDYYN